MLGANKCRFKGYMEAALSDPGLNHDDGVARLLSAARARATAALTCAGAVPPM